MLANIGRYLLFGVWSHLNGFADIMGRYLSRPHGSYILRIFTLAGSASSLLVADALLVSISPLSWTVPIPLLSTGPTLCHLRANRTPVPGSLLFRRPIKSSFSVLVLVTIS
uniref:(northern house mosquito) hypothetical protein n=1 Tax=Culex pipiens TaxID=7175 RepID=A0A8D8HHT5_CULPI